MNKETDKSNQSLDTANAVYYRYLRPDYRKFVKGCKPNWLGMIYFLMNDDDPYQICNLVWRGCQNIPTDDRTRDLRYYVYFILSEYEKDCAYYPWVLLGAFWLMAKMKWEDGVDLILETLRQDAFFFNTFFNDYEAVVAAALYELGKNKTDDLESFMREDGLMPQAKVIVFTALTQIVNGSESKEEKLPTFLAWCNEYFADCVSEYKKGQCFDEIDYYIAALVNLHVEEALPLIEKCLKALPVLKDIIHVGVTDIKDIINDSERYLSKKYPVINDYLLAQWSGGTELLDMEDVGIGSLGEWHDDDEVTYDKDKDSKLFTISVRLNNAENLGHTVSVRLKVCSNMRLSALMEILMVAFDQKYDEWGSIIVPEYVFLDKYGNYYSKKYGWTTDALLDAGLNTSNSYDNVLSDVLQKPGDVLRMYTRYFTIEPWSHDVILETTDDREYCLPTLLSSEGCYPSDEADTIASYYQLVKDGIITPKTNSEIKKRFDDWADTAVGL
jgi:hypothetical protein